jgi:hypothetical protein
MLRNFGNPNNVPALVSEIERTNDSELKSLGFVEVMRLTRNQPATQRDIANKMFHEQLVLADDALKVLVELADARRPR